MHRIHLYMMAFYVNFEQMVPVTQALGTHWLLQSPVPASDRSFHCSTVYHSLQTSCNNDLVSPQLEDFSFHINFECVTID